MPAKEPRMAIAVNMAKKQLKAIDRDAINSGQSRRMFVQKIIEDYLLSPDDLIPSIVHKQADTVTIHIYLTVPLHTSLTKLAKKLGVTRTVIAVSAINKHYQLR